MNEAGTRSAAEPPFSDLEKKAWIALFALSTLLHLVQLGSHALHHDESIHAWAALHLIQDGTYKYDPVYHGPIQYYAVAATYGVASAVGKVAGVLFGPGAIAAAIASRRQQRQWGNEVSLFTLWGVFFFGVVETLAGGVFIFGMLSK